jgi:alkaline phosphatase
MLSRLCIAISAGALLIACGDGGGEAVDAAPDAPDAHYPLGVSCGDDPEPAGPVTLPKNIIFIMGDGMGPVQLRAGQIKKGEPLHLESLGEPIYFNTDSLTTDQSTAPDDDPTDSAAAATAFATGVRTLNDAVGQDADGAALPTIVDVAQAAGKAIGIVTTSYVYDGSPAAYYAHTDDRDNYDQIITDLVTDAQPDLLFGGGRPIFEENGDAFLNMATGAGYHILRDEDELNAWDPATDPKVLGLFHGTAVSDAPTLWEWFTTPVSLREPDSTDPRLPLMTQRALDRLDDDEDGFFLLVENEHIDTMGHIALIKRELVYEGLPIEVIELDDAVRVATDWIEANSSFEETLLIVTADHECGGYQLFEDNLDDPFFWASPFHSRLPVAVYARGPGAEKLSSVCRGSDLYFLQTGQLP